MEKKIYIVLLIFVLLFFKKLNAQSSHDFYITNGVGYSLIDDHGGFQLDLSVEMFVLNKLSYEMGVNYSSTFKTVEHESISIDETLEYLEGYKTSFQASLFSPYLAMKYYLLKNNKHQLGLGLGLALNFYEDEYIVFNALNRIHTIYGDRIGTIGLNIMSKLDYTYFLNDRLGINITANANNANNALIKSLCGGLKVKL